MQTFYLVCAVLGGAVLVLQLVLGLAGVDWSADHDVHAGGLAEGFELLSVRAVAAAVAFFGLTGLGVSAGGLGPWLALPIAAAGGLVAAGTVAALMRQLGRLEDDGTVRIEGALGHQGTVYVPIPGARAGTGKVLLTLQNRTVECQAVTPAEDLATGTAVTVVDVVGPDVVEVVMTPLLGDLSNA
jgi:hypothetical protein